MTATGRSRGLVSGAAGAALLVLACGAPDFTVDPVEFTAPPGSMAPSLTAAGDTAILSWTEPTPSGHRVRVAVRAGGVWLEPHTVVASDSLFANWADFPSVAIFPDGRWLIHWLQKTAPATYAYHVTMAVSSDQGVTWGSRVRPHGDQSATEHGFVAMTPVADGIAAIWLDGRKGATDSAPAMSLRFTTIRSDGTVAPDEELDGRACDCCQTALASSSSGLVAAYRDRSEAEIRDIVVTRRTPGGWTPPVKVHDDGWHYPGCPVNGPQLATHGDTVGIAWFTNARDTARVLVAFSTDGGATFGTPVPVHERRPLGRVALTALPDGAVAVAWLEELAGDVDGAVRLRRVEMNGTMGPPVTIAETESSRRAGFPRLAAVPDGVLATWRGSGEDGAVQVRLMRIPN